jgi:hypothetical protein
MTYPYTSDTYSGWDFTSTWKADVSPVQNGGYPLLAASDVFQVIVQVYPPGAGTVSGDGYYLSGQQAQLQATAKQQFVFKGWIKNTELISQQLQLAMKVSGNSSLVARFESKTTALVQNPPLFTPKLRIYPNPAKELVWVDFSSLREEVTVVSVVNMTGQTVRQIYIQSGDPMQKTVDVSDLKSGVYILFVRMGNGLISERFTKY